ncbi:MAG: ammonium transporter [Fibrobacteraceae bacterium]|nr:ammonium transporter [Fibrobacteraceae bacterium]
MDLAAKSFISLNNLWVLIGGFLVFAMHLGFACVETGLCRAKNATNILCKNTLTPAIGFTTFALIGYGLMFPALNGDHWILGKILGFAGFGIHASGTIAQGATTTDWTWFFFQGMFAATGGTIVSGAVAERIKLSAYMVFTAIFVMFVYPIIGSWGWGGGFLVSESFAKIAGSVFHDFAGSAFVHTVGGCGALAGVIILGPRIGKYVGGKPRPIMGHNMGLATIGVFLLWLGWFGFNGASTVNTDPGLLSLVEVNTMIAASAGILGALLMSKMLLHKPDLSMVLNGCLAGLVGVTAGADCIGIFPAVLIGFICGVVVVVAVLFFDKIRLDDPVGALSVHFVCGILGTLAVGIFSPYYTFLAQLIGIFVVGAVAFSSAFAIFSLLKITMGIRVSEKSELKGLDIAEHGGEAYSGFQFFSNM